MRIFILSLFFLLNCTEAMGKLQVMTTTTNLKSLVEKIGGDDVKVTYFSRGTQDPHYLEAKPSFMLKASKADLLVSIGLGLEVGWLPLIIRGARNPALNSEKGHLVVGNHIETLGKKNKQVSRAEGDVHPEGNPHFLLDPMRALKTAKLIVEKLSTLNPVKEKEFRRRYEQFKNKLEGKIEGWKKRIPEGQKVITYHKTLTYFYDFFGIENIAILEPKPGIPPTASHILKVMKKAKELDVSLVLVENYFDKTVAQRVAREIEGMKVREIPVAVGGEDDVEDLIQLYDVLVESVSEGE